MLRTAPALALILVASASGEETVTLAELREEARATNPAILAARARRDARAERHAQATSLPDPMLSLGLQVDPVETRVGPQRGALGISQTFPTAGKRRLRGAIADQQAAAAGEELRAVTLRVEEELARAYYEYWFTRRSREVTREVMELVRAGEEVARTRYVGGRGGQEVILKAQVELGVLEDRLRTLDELEPTRVEAILALLDRPAGETLAPPDPGDLAEREVVHSLEVLREMAARAAPAVRELELRAGAKELETRLARKATAPDLTLGLSWIPTGAARNPLTPGSGDDPLIATLAVNLPVRKARYRAAARERALEREALDRARAGEVNAIESALKKAWFAYSDGRRKLALYRDNLVPKGRQSLEATFASFQSGRASFLDLLDAERVLLEFELAHARGVADHLAAIAEIERLVAAPVSREVGP